MKIAKLFCLKCDEVILKCPAEKYKKSEQLAEYLRQKHRREKHPIYCESCNSEIKQLAIDDFGDEIDWHTPWEQYLCDVCHSKIWGALLDTACGMCETEPCKKGRDCWVNPFPKIMYLCYVAPKKDAHETIANV